MLPKTYIMDLYCPACNRTNIYLSTVVNYVYYLGKRIVYDDYGSSYCRDCGTYVLDEIKEREEYISNEKITAEKDFGSLNINYVLKEKTAVLSSVTRDYVWYITLTSGFCFRKKIRESGNFHLLNKCDIIYLKDEILDSYKMYELIYSLEVLSKDN